MQLARSLDLFHDSRDASTLTRSSRLDSTTRTSIALFACFLSLSPSMREIAHPARLRCSVRTRHDRALSLTNTLRCETTPFLRLVLELRRSADFDFARSARSLESLESRDTREPLGSMPCDSLRALRAGACNRSILKRGRHLQDVVVSPKLLRGLFAEGDISGQGIRGQRGTLSGSI